MKLTEEVGEVADAFISMHGLNARKGVCRTRDDLLDELADVIITATVAMNRVTGDVAGPAATWAAPGRGCRAGRSAFRPRLTADR